VIALPDLPPQPVDASSSNEIAPTLITAYTEQGQRAVETFAINVWTIPVEKGVFIRLHDALEAQFDDVDITIPKWQLDIEPERLPYVEDELARHFLRYHRGAERDSLSEEEREVWERMVDSVDYHRFTLERSRPLYEEGLLLAKTPHLRVEWSDGAREALARSFAPVLHVVEPGEWFGAYIKRDHHGNTKALETLSLLGKPDEALYDFDRIATPDTLEAAENGAGYGGE
jgi:hypothetical protein